MDKPAKGMRPEDIRSLKKICKDMDSFGREKAKDKFGEGKTHLSTKWELYHLIEFAKPIYEIVGIELDKALEKRGIVRGFEWVRNAGSQRGIDPVRKARPIFEALADAQEISLLECFRDFLVFCRGDDEEEYRPLAAFDYERSVLIEAIEDIENHVNEATKEKAVEEIFSGTFENTPTDKHHANPQVCPEKESPSGLRIQWVDNDAGRKVICKIDEVAGGKELRRPSDRDNLSLDSVSGLLDWQHHLTSFVGRAQELKKLRRCLHLPSKKSIQLIYGEGGAGKTRLAFHFAQEVSDKPGWEAGRPDEEIEGTWRMGNKGTLLILDYPEERADRVAQFARGLRKMPDIGPKLRVLLLSRNRDFVKRLIDPARPFETNQPLHLSRLENEDDQWDL